MRIPKITEGTDRLLTLSVYTESRLKAYADTKDLAPALGTPTKALKEAQAHHDATSVALTTASALRDTADIDSDDLLRRLYYRTEEVQVTNGGRARVKLYFPKGLTGLIRTNTMEQPAEMRVLAGRLAQDDNPELQGFASLILEKADSLDEANGNYLAATEAMQVAFGQVIRTRGEWIKKYEKVYGELIVNVGKKKAETFFKKQPKKRKKPSNPA